MHDEIKTTSSTTRGVINESEISFVSYRRPGARPPRCLGNLQCGGIAGSEHSVKNYELGVETKLSTLHLQNGNPEPWMESLVEELSSSSLKVTRIEYAAEFSSRNGERFAEWEKDLGWGVRRRGDLSMKMGVLIICLEEVDR